MEDIKPINEKTEGDCGYVAGYKGKKISLYAKTLSAASELGRQHLKVTKKDSGMFWVTLAERADGTILSQSTMI